MTLSRSYQDEIGSVREYELIVILRPETSSDDIKTLIKRVSDVVERKEGRIASIENWGRRRLAYEIRKERKGIYLYWRILGYFELMAEVERVLRMIEKVIRYMTILVDADVDPNARPAEFSDDMVKAVADLNAVEEEPEVKPAPEKMEEGSNDEDSDSDADDDEEDKD
ncbi:MAG: 30S ribosomal protein S6 [Deltaproteobacteria bacterium]|nr:30S ribosomal protein S6 [Deltaproteobacteria bacterium]